MARKRIEPPPLEQREFRSPEEIDGAIAKLRRRIAELERLDVQAAVLQHTGAIEVARSNVRGTILDVFGENSPEFREHQYIDIWGGPMLMGMHQSQIIAGIQRGRAEVIAILKGLIGRLEGIRREGLPAVHRREARLHEEGLRGNLEESHLRSRRTHSFA